MPSFTSPFEARLTRHAVQALGIALLTAAGTSRATTYSLDVGTLAQGGSMLSSLGKAIAPVPEPTSAALLLSGLIGVSSLARRRSKAR